MAPRAVSGPAGNIQEKSAKETYLHRIFRPVNGAKSLCFVSGVSIFLFAQCPDWNEGHPSPAAGVFGNRA